MRDREAFKDRDVAQGCIVRGLVGQGERVAAMGGGQSVSNSMGSKSPEIKYLPSGSIIRTIDASPSPKRSKSPTSSPVSSAHQKLLNKTHNAAQNRTEREARILIAQGKADRTLMSTESILFGGGNAFQRRRSLTIALNEGDDGQPTKAVELYGTTKAGRKTQELVEASRQRRLSDVGNLANDPNSPTAKLFIGDTQAAEDFFDFQVATRGRNEMLRAAADTTPEQPCRPDVSATCVEILLSFRKHPRCQAMIDKWQVQWREVPDEEQGVDDETTAKKVNDDPGIDESSAKISEESGQGTIKTWYAERAERPEQMDGWYMFPDALVKRHAKQVAVTGLEPLCDLLEFRVRASSPGGGWSEFSLPSAIIQTLQPELVAPAPPHVQAIQATTVLLKWDPPDKRIGVSVTYKIKGRRLDKARGSKNSFVVLYMGKETSFNVGNTGAQLTPGTEYEFTLTYICPDGRKLESSVAQTRTLNVSDHVYANKRESGEELPLGWTEEKDERTGDVYYYHMDSGATQWDPPEQLSIPPLITPFAKKRFAFLFYLWGAPHANRSIQSLSIRRNSLLLDSFRQFKQFEMANLRSKLRVEFQGEPGIDSGGLTKDWFLSVSKYIVDPGLCLFQYHKDTRCYHVDRRSSINEEHLEYFEFMGKILAKAVFERHMVDVQLCKGLLRQLCGQPLKLEDLGEIDPQYFIGLSWMLHNSIDGVIYENFSVLVDHFGSMEEIEIVPGGKKIEVTDGNKKEYVEAVARWRLRDSVSDQLDAILRGFHTLIPPAAAACLRPSELELLLNGRREIDLENLKAKTQYTGGFTAVSPAVHYFWQAMKKMTNDQRRQVLKFCTGSSQFPLDNYDPPFTITLAEGDTLDALPRAHTCFNQIVFPPYESPKVLKAKLSFAMENTEGFELT